MPGKLRDKVSRLAVLRATRKVLSDPDRLEVPFEDLSALAAEVFVEITGGTLAQAKENDPRVDWEAILAFIEGLLPFILQILSLFGL